MTKEELFRLSGMIDQSALHPPAGNSDIPAKSFASCTSIEMERRFLCRQASLNLRLYGKTD